MHSSPLFWTLRAIARLERAGGVRAPRLTEPDFAKWHRYRRKLGWADFIRLLHEDLAPTFPEPFDTTRWAHDPYADLGDDDHAGRLVREAAKPDDSDTQRFLRSAARALGLPAGGDISALPKVQPHQRAVELPGSGGRIAAYQALRHDLSFGQAFTFLARTDAERVAIGLAAVELRGDEPRIVTPSAFDAGGTEISLGVPCEQGRAAAESLGLEARWA